MLTLDSPLTDAVGASSAKVLAAELDLHSVADLLRHYPRKYLHTGDVTSESSLTKGDFLSFYAEVISSKFYPARNATNRMKGRCVVTLRLQEGAIDAVFWNQRWMETKLKPGTRALFNGLVGTFNGRWQLESPSAEVLVDGALPADKDHKGLTFTSMSAFDDRLMPIYPATSGIDSGSVRRCVELTLEMLPTVPDPIAQADLDAFGMIDLDTAFRDKHMPKDKVQWRAADRRLKLQEALVMQLALSVDRYESRLLPAIARPAVDGGLLAKLDADLPFSLTAGQRNAGEVLSTELGQAHPMHRLLQGDVGSGKTLVALRAMLQVAASGGQSALLAPTEVLAHQHARSIGALLAPYGEPGTIGADENAVKVAVLSAGMSAAKRKQAMLDAASGAAAIVIGTHALLEDKVTFADLGFVVIDEQHRFGVEQRDRLRRKGRDGTSPHTLVMTATPIPRTIAITAFGDLEPIIMSDLPPGRSPIHTTAIPASDKPAWLDRAWKRVREEIAAGHQAYVVCPRIGLDDAKADEEASADDDDKRKQAAVLEIEQWLREGPLRGLRLAILHGRLHPDEKDEIMQSFGRGEIDVLVSTTVIEVGVDVPNATAMVVLDADLFGLATLHQLRGRVGRGSAQGLCLLVTPMHPASKPFERLRVLEESTDGFEIAERDLQLRREGDILGVTQSGTRSQLKLLSLREDVDTIELARELCDRIVAQDPQLEAYPTLRSQLASLDQQRTFDYLLKG